MAVTIFAGASGSGYASWPALVKLPNGDRFCSFSDGTGHLGDSTVVKGSLSTDGVTWGSAVTIASEAGKRNLSSLGLFYNAVDGSLLCPYSREDNGPGTIREPKIRRSTASPWTSWSDWSTISPPSGYTWISHYGEIFRVGSDLYMPMYGLQTSSGKTDSLIFKSTDEGATWALHGTIASSGSFDHNEASVVQVNDNLWLAVVRRSLVGDDELYQATSTDAGVTWGGLTFLDGDTAVSPSLLRIGSSEIYLAFASRQIINELRLWSTYDGGATWVLETVYRGGIVNSDFGYPALVNDAGALKFAYYSSSSDVLFEVWDIAVPAEIPDYLDSLSCFYELEEMSGQRNDAFGVNHLTDTNGVTQASGKVGACAEFASGSSQLLSRASNASLQTGDIDFTVGGWGQMATVTGEQCLISKSSTTEIEYIFESVTGAEFNCLAFFVGAGIAKALDYGLPSAGVWFCFFAWYDSATNQLKIQIDNGFVDVTESVSPPTAASEPLRLGSYGTGQFHNGLIDQIGFWKRKLTVRERREFYNEGVGLTFAQMRSISLGPTTSFTMNTLRPRVFAPGLAR